MASQRLDALRRQNRSILAHTDPVCCKVTHDVLCIPHGKFSDREVLSAIDARLGRLQKRPNDYPEGDAAKEGLGDCALIYTKVMEAAALQLRAYQVCILYFLFQN